jgi:putative transposase
MKNESVFDSIVHAKGQWAYHLEWCPKYRFRIFRQLKYRESMDTILRAIAVSKGIEVLELAVQPEHVHAVVRIPPNMSLSQAIQFLKGGSAYIFFHEHPIFRMRYKKGHLWSRGKFYRTVGDVDLETTRDYVRKQDTLHQTTLQEYAS